MRGYLDTLDMPDIALDEDTRRRYLDTVRGETRRLERIVTDLLDLARFENGVAALDARVFAIERAVRVGRAPVRARGRSSPGSTIRTHVADVGRSADRPIRIASIRRSAISSPTRCGTRRRAARSISRRARQRRRLSAVGDRLGRRHRARARRRTCSIGSTRSMRRGRGGTRAGAASACRSSRRSSSAMAARSPSPAGRARTAFVITLPQARGAAERGGVGHQSTCRRTCSRRPRP